jgi:hypothetical protein
MATGPLEASRSGLPSEVALEVRLQSLEKGVAELQPKAHQPPKGKDAWDKFEKISSILWPVVALLVSIFVTGRIENVLKERQLHLENVKDMQQLIQSLNTAPPETASSIALVLGAHGRYAVAPMIELLQAGQPEHLPAAVAGLRSAAAIDHDFVCKQLTGVIMNRTRLYQLEVHQTAIGLLGDLDCQQAAQPLRDYIAKLQPPNPENAPFTPVPGTQGVTPANLTDAKTRAEAALKALTE